MLTQILLTLFLVVQTLSGQQITPCKWTDPLTGQQYDFSGLYRPNGWTIMDPKPYNVATQTMNFEYLFNICGNYPTTCRDQQAVAFQSLVSGGKLVERCMILAKNPQPTFSVIPPEEVPLSDGVRVSFDGGDVCESSSDPAELGKPMKFSADIYCAKLEELTLRNSSVCNSGVTIKSPAGCPVIPSSFTVFSVTWKLLLVFVIYLITRTIYNVKVNRMRLSEAIPHRKFLVKGTKKTIIAINNLYLWIKTPDPAERPQKMKGYYNI